MKTCSRNTCRRVLDIAIASLFVVVLAGAAPPINASPAARALPAAGFSLGSITIGASVLDAVKRFGAPDVVRTTDLGYEWQWVEAGGLDREVLADSDMIVHQVLIALPAPVPNRPPPPIVEPAEFRALAVPVDDAAGVVAAAGGSTVVEPDPAVRAWSFPGGMLVAELEEGLVGRLLALDDAMARRVGYLAPPSGDKPVIYRAPVLTRDFYAPYPDAPLRAGIEGRAVVRVVIDTAGKPKDERIVVSSGNADIDAAALESDKKSVFRPAHCDDVPCEGVYFDLQDFTLFRD